MSKFSKKAKVGQGTDLKDVVPWDVDESVTLVMDLDQICYVVAAACQETLLEYSNKDSEGKGLFKNKTQFKNFMKGIEFSPDAFEVESIVKLEKMVNAISTLKRRINNICKQTKCHPDNLELYIGGKGNFREKLPFPFKYKHNRKDIELPVLLKDLRQYCVDYLDATTIHGEEVDDVISRRMYDGYKSGKKIIGASTDKDNRMTSGWLFIPDVSESPEFIDGLGSLYLNNAKKLKGTGRLWLYAQCCMGDPTDGMNPRDVVEQVTGKKPRFGDATCYKLLKDCNNDKEALTVVTNLYKGWLGEDEFNYTDWTGKVHTVTWVDILELYFLGVWMRQNEGDTTSIKNILKKVGLLQ